MMNMIVKKLLSLFAQRTTYIILVNVCDWIHLRYSQHGDAFNTPGGTTSGIRGYETHGGAMLLRHINFAVTQACYIKTAGEDAKAAMQKLETALN